MGAFFLLGCLYAFIRSTDSPRPLPWQVLSIVSLAAGFGTKETIVVAPLLVWMYDATFVEGGAARAWQARKGFYRALGGVAAVAFLVFVVPQLFAEQSTAGFGLKEHGPIAYALSQPGVILHYLRLALVPYPLVLDYDWPVAKGLGEWLPQTLVVLALLAVTAGLLARRSWIGFAAAWFFVCLAPTSSIVPIKDLAFEHRTYLPLAGVLALLVGGGYWLCVRFAASAPRLPAVVALALCLAFTALTVLRNREYRASDDLWRTVVERAPANPRGHSNPAHELIGQGKLDEAMVELGTTLKLDPLSPAPIAWATCTACAASGTRPSRAYLDAIDVSDLPAYRYGLPARSSARAPSARPRPATARRSSSSPTSPRTTSAWPTRSTASIASPRPRASTARRCGSIPSCRRRTRTSPRSCSPRARRARPSSTT
jgi:hypothetical protein